jgi:hypothetical protein
MQSQANIASFLLKQQSNEFSRHLLMNLSLNFRGVDPDKDLIWAEGLARRSFDVRPSIELHQEICS